MIPPRPFNNYVTVLLDPVRLPAKTTRCPRCYAHLGENGEHMDSGMVGSCDWPGWPA